MELFRRFRMFVLVSIIVSLGIFGGCSASDEPEVEPESPIKERSQILPVTETVQTVNLPSSQAWTTMLEILRARNVAVAFSDEITGKIQTAGVKMNDVLCGTFPRANASLPCVTRYFVEIEGLTPKASSVSIRYLEECPDRQQLNMECPGSNAEQLMRAIIDDFKAAAKVPG